MKWILPAALISVMGCAHAPLTCPAKGGPAWLELGSAHFILRTDQSESAARAELQGMEQRAALLQQLAFPSLPTPRERLEVVLFEHQYDYADLFPEKIDQPDFSMLPSDRGQQIGFVTNDRDMDERPVMVTFSTTWETLQHELIHWFMGYSAPGAPRWLNEGLAQYFETLEIDFEASEVLVGKPPDVEASEDWPTARELVTADADRFYDRLRAFANYSAAWFFIHLLVNRYPDQLARYRADMQRGAGSIQAWLAEFGDDWEPWNRALREYKIDVSDRPDAPLAVRVKLPHLEPPQIEWVKPLGDERVHVLWARLRSWRGKRSRARVQADLDEAAAVAPHSAEVRFWRARFAQARGRSDDAEREARAALASRSDRLPRQLRSRAHLVHALVAERLDPLDLRRLQVRQFDADRERRVGTIGDVDLVLAQRAIPRLPLVRRTRRATLESIQRRAAYPRDSARADRDID